jgi:transposase
MKGGQVLVVNFGADTHKAWLELAAVDEPGRRIAARRFANDETGCVEALEWIRSFGGKRVIGVEGSGLYGAALTRILIEAGEDVREVPALLVHGERKKRHSQGKSDRVDAFSVAKVVATGEGLCALKFSKLHEELKLLVDERKSLVRMKTQLINQIHCDLVILHPGYEKQLPRLNRRVHLAKARTLLEGETSVRQGLALHRLDEIDRTLSRIAALEKTIKEKVVASGTTLHRQCGLSYLLAATILGEVGHPSRVGSEGAFAMLNGTAPVEASSGKVQHHRLNRRGNRQLNYAIHTVALVRARSDERSRAFMSKKRQEGKSYKDAMRCLKRHVSNDVYRRLINDAKSVQFED